MPKFVDDVEQIRRRAQDKIEEGAVTQSYRGDAEQTISILNEALATEIVCVLRYMHHYFMATGVHGKSVADEFKEHADSEREHADAIAERIQQLGGKPDFNPRSLLERSASQYVEGETLAEMIREDLIAERLVIEVYQKMIRHFGDDDPTTRVMIEGILRDEEEHASDLADMLYITDPETGKTEGKDPGTDPLRMERQRQQAHGNGQRQNKRPMRRPEPQQRSQKQRERDQKPAEPITPDFISARERERRNQQQGWRPGESSPRVHEAVSKRHESSKAGSPGAPEFSGRGPQGGSSAQDQGQLRRNRKGNRGGKAA